MDLTHNLLSRPLPRRAWARRGAGSPTFPYRAWGARAASGCNRMPCSRGIHAGIDCFDRQGSQQASPRAGQGSRRLGAQLARWRACGRDRSAL